ncbi:MAG: isochorismate synthase [Opitutales bacterium]
MDVLPADRFPNRDRDGLAAFFEYCQAEAAAAGRPKLASITLDVPHIAPLAVLDAIYEPGNLHFYLEHPTLDLAVAGAESAFAETFAGPDRISAMATFWDTVRADCILTGDTDGPFAGPHAFFGIAFHDEPEAGTAFAPATLFVPRWQVSRSGGRYRAVANCPIPPEGNLAPLVDRIWAAHSRFMTFQYEPAGDTNQLPARLEATHLVGEGPGGFRDRVRSAVREIEAGAYQKIVQARALDLQFSERLHPLQTLNLLRERFAGCYAFSFANGEGQSFIGATPERLVETRNGRFRTMALAGTTRRGSTVAEDATLGRALLESEKDRYEQQVVIDAIRRRLQRLGVTSVDEDGRRLMPLSNVQHLLTPLSGALPAGLHFFDLLGVLHPTPAVGGSPRDVTRERLRAIEPFPRGLYAGALGYCDVQGNGESVVAIRSAEIDDNRARLFAGCGIVEGSDPEKEEAETEMKFRAMREALVVES